VRRSWGEIAGSVAPHSEFSDEVSAVLGGDPRDRDSNVRNRPDFDNETGHEVGVSFPIYLRRVFQGPFLEPGIIARRFDHTCEGCSGTGDEHAGPEVLFGWQWSFDSGLNVAMALGAMRNLNGGSSSPEPAGYFRIGYLL
jgi:hypothetical protein